MPSDHLIYHHFHVTDEETEIQRGEVSRAKITELVNGRTVTVASKSAALGCHYS